jgi:hypothetical protein
MLEIIMDGDEAVNAEEIVNREKVVIVANTFFFCI